MTREFLVTRVASVSLSAFIFVLSFRLVLDLFGFVGLYQGFFHLFALGLTVSIPLGISTLFFLLFENGVDKKLEKDKDYFEDLHLDAQ